MSEVMRPAQFDDPTAVKDALLHGFSRCKVLVVGDLMLDAYIRGHVARLSPEAPVPVVLAAQQDADDDFCLGGAANAALNLARLGVQVALVGMVGKDTSGDILVSKATREGMDIGGVLRTQIRETTTKTRVMGGRQQLARIDVEDTNPIDAGTMADLTDALWTTIQRQQPDAIILSDYAKGLATPEFCQKLFSLAKERGIPVYVDPKGSDLERYIGASIVKPNAVEMAGFAAEYGWGSDLVEAAEKMREHLGADHIALTLGSGGIALTGEGRFCNTDFDQKRVFDVSGAGDTVMAVVSASLASGLSGPDAVRLANIAALQVIQEVGTRPVDRDRLLVSVIESIRRDSGSKHFGLDDLAEVCRAWQRQGLKVAMTNGCFDLLHAGHVKLLESCARTADRLVVAVNSDESITRLKGEGRPLMPEDQRVTVLSALQSIDAVVVFGEDTPIDVVRALRPDVLVKGADYTKDKVVGADVVESYGGKVELVPLWDGLSTTRLAAAISKL